MDFSLKGFDIPVKRLRLSWLWADLERKWIFLVFITWLFQSVLWLEDITDGQPPTESLKHTAGGYKIFLEKYFTTTSFKFSKIISLFLLYIY